MLGEWKREGDPPPARFCMRGRWRREYLTSGSLLHAREFDVALAMPAVDVVLGRGVVSGVMEVKMTKMGHEFHRGPFS